MHDQIADCQEQQRDRRESLLTINDVVFNFAAIRHHGGHDAAKEVAASAILDNLNEVIEKLTAVIQLPVIFPLVNRNDKPLVCTFHETSHFRF